MSKRTMSDAEMTARMASTGAVLQAGLVSLPNHLTPDPFAPDHARANRSHLWWGRKGDHWVAL